MKTQPQHTQKPWRIEGSYGHRDILEGDRVVAENVEVNRAARIVRAVNAHEELIGALKMALDAEESLAAKVSRPKRIEIMKQAIARAEGKAL